MYFLGVPYLFFPFSFVYKQSCQLLPDNRSFSWNSWKIHNSTYYIKFSWKIHWKHVFAMKCEFSLPVHRLLISCKFGTFHYFFLFLIKIWSTGWSSFCMLFLFWHFLLPSELIRQKAWEEMGNIASKFLFTYCGIPDHKSKIDFSHNCICYYWNSYALKY